MCVCVKVVVDENSDADERAFSNQAASCEGKRRLRPGRDRLKWVRGREGEISLAEGLPGADTSN